MFRKDRCVYGSISMYIVCACVCVCLRVCMCYVSVCVVWYVYLRVAVCEARSKGELEEMCVVIDRVLDTELFSFSNSLHFLHVIVQELNAPVHLSMARV